MSLKTFVKVGNIRNLSDARYCAGMEVNLLGFPFDATSGVDPETFNEIKGWLSGVQYVAEFDTADPNDMLHVIGQSEVDFIQIKRIEWLERVQDIAPTILEVDINEINAVPTNLHLAYVLVSGQEENTLASDQKQDLNVLSESYKVILGTGFTPENVEQILNELSVEGISMNGSEEIRPGYKDYDELADILELLEEDN